MKYCLPLIGRIYYLIYLTFLPFNKKQSFHFLLASFRYSRIPKSVKSIKHQLPTMGSFLKQAVSKIEFNESADYINGYQRVLVLNNPFIEDDLIIKGVVLIKFTHTFAYYLNVIDVQNLSKYFHIVLEPSWAGYAIPEILCWSQLDEKVLVESSEVTDFDFLSQLETNLLPVRFGSSDWVDPRVFKSLDLEKEYDAIYIANFNYIKRHHIYFKALSKLKAENFKAALVCGEWGSGKKDIERLIEYYELQDVLDVFFGLSQADLNVLLNKSKVNVLLSLKEGSNRAVFEGFFANVPGIVLKTNIGVNKNYINDCTGLLIDEADLVSTLRFFRKNYMTFSPQQWALEHISPILTTKKLIDALYGPEAIDDIEHWGHKTAPKVNKPEAGYYYDSDKGRFLDSKTLIDLFRNGNHVDLKAELVKEVKCLRE
jgi:glycosyltransferase involved in cell wall biosynthesis